MKEKVLRAEGPDLSESTEGFPKEMICESQKELIRQSGNSEERKRKKYLSK